MPRFNVGDRVWVRLCHTWPELEGTKGTIVSWDEMVLGIQLPEEVSVLPDAWVGTERAEFVTFAPHESQLVRSID